MTNYMIPTNDRMVEQVAKAIARQRLHDESLVVLQNQGLAGVIPEDAFDRVFETLWSGIDETDERNKEEYRRDARSAIAAINLAMLIE